jgi:sugar lactone lactonase YvrE
MSPINHQIVGSQFCPEGLMSMVGKTLAHYEITNQLGKGGMGDDYQAKDQRLGRDVAIKVLPEEFAKHTDCVADFQREAKLLTSLNHLSIASIYARSEGLSRSVLSMKYLLRMMLVCFYIAHLSFSCLAQFRIITTYAGPPLPANGTLATTQFIDDVSSVTPDGVGGFYFTSIPQNRVYRVSINGMLSLIAGSGADGFSGDGGSATSARLSGPGGVSVDSAGNLFISDYQNNRIRKVSSSGIITTVAGGGSNVLGDGGPATSARLDRPNGVTVDSAGNIFIADYGHGRIRKVSSSGIITTVAGGGSNAPVDGGTATSIALTYIAGVAVDSANNLYFAENSKDRIYKVSSSGIITTVAGGGTNRLGNGGPATAAQLSDPAGVAVDSAGNLFIADGGYIRKVSTLGIITIVAGGGGPADRLGDGGPATSAELYDPTGVSVDSAGNLFIADNRRIRKVSSSGIITTVAGNGKSSIGFSGDGGPATSARLSSPSNVTVDSEGNLFIVDRDNQRIRKVSPLGIITTVAGDGSISCELLGCHGNYGGDGGSATAAKLNDPGGVAIDSAGNLFIADFGNRRVRKVSPSGIISTVAGGGTNELGDGGPATSATLNSPAGVAIDSAGNLFIADFNDRRIRKVSSSGIITTIAGGGSASNRLGDDGPATSAQLGGPSGVAVDSAGNLFIADELGNRIRKVSTLGIITTVAGNGSSGYSGDGGPATSARLSLPSDVAVDSAGNLFIADSFNNRIRKVSSSGIIATVAGDGSFGYSGDGGLAISAQLDDPFGVAVDSTGNLYVADTNNSRIRKVTKPNVSIPLALNAGGAGQSSTLGGNPDTQPGYATVSVSSGAAPYGTAVFSLKQNGVTVTEAGVPASPPTTSARIFIDYRTGVAAVPGRMDAGRIDINTGIALVNNGSATANVTYTLRELNGVTVNVGHGTMTAGKHFAKFIDQLKDIAPDFNLPSNFQIGSLEINSTQPLSVLALRGTTNQRNEFLITTTPVADLTRTLGNSSIYFPQFVDGGGYTTSLILLNTSNAREMGKLEIRDKDGNPLSVNQVGGTRDSSFNYSIEPGGLFRFQTDGFPADTKAGWLRLTPDAGTSTPVGSGVFGYNPNDVLVSEAGIPAASATTHARVYADLSKNHNTGLAIANISNTGSNITINAYQKDGVTAAGASKPAVPLPANGYTAGFANGFVTGLPAGFTGVLDISSPVPFAALTLRSLDNERGNFLMTTFPVADANRAAPSPIVFPQVADGGGYVTEFILISGGEGSSMALEYYDENGMPTDFGE